VSREFLKDRRESLEDEFFHKLQSEQLAKLRGELDRKQSREELRAASGIADEAVLDQLIALGLSGTTTAALSMVPLVWVAWADGAVSEAERSAVLQAARERGLDAGNPAQQILSGWLERKPESRLFDAWAAYARALSDTLVPAQRAQLKEQIVGLARKVAEAAGGFLGMRKISQQEEAALSSVAAAFGD
jgi:hypothetical protein